MMEDQKKSYGAGGRIPSAGGSKGVQAGPEASLSSDCNVRVVDHLATLADTASSENQLVVDRSKSADSSQEPEMFKRSSLTMRSPTRKSGGEEDDILGKNKTGERREETDNDEENGFKRSNILCTTPPRIHRTLSLDREKPSRGRKKRKAEQSPQMEHAHKEKATLWLRLVEKVSKLRKLVIDNPTTRLEIKKNSEDLQSLVTILSNLEEASDKDIDIDQEDQQDTIKSFSTIGSQTKEVGYQTVATQTEKKTNSNENNLESSPTTPTAK